MTTAPGRAFDHVVIIMFENEYRSYVMGNEYMFGLAQKGIDMATYFGVMHPSNTNYTASMAGSICNITQDPMYNTLMPAAPPSSPPPMLDETPLVARFRDGLDWRGYFEAYQPIRFPPQTDFVMKDQGTASATIVVGTAASPTAAATMSPPADVSLTLTAPSTVTPGQTFDVTIVASNTSGGFQFNVIVDCPTPQGLTLVSPTFPHTVGMLYPGQPSTITAVYTADATFTGTVTIAARASAADQAESGRQTILDYPPYLNMHNPFVQFKSIRTDPKQWSRIGTIYDFLRDALNGTLPEYSWITPDIWGDGHWMWGTYDEAAERGTVLVDQLARWLKNFFDVLAFPGPNSRLPKRTLVVVTFDEADYNVSWQYLKEYDGTYDGPNQIYTVLLGDDVILHRPRRILQEGYNHYSLMKTIEQNFGLESLGKNDKDANWFQFLWNREFHWGTAATTPIASASFVAAAGMNGVLYVVADASLYTYANGTWGSASAVPLPAGTTAVALAACGNQLVLACNAGGTLSALTWTASAGWSQAQTLAQGVGVLAMTSYVDYSDQTSKVMLVYSLTASNAIQSQIFASGVWAAAVPVNQQTDTGITVASLGASLLLIYKVVGGNTMNAISYNTADFNVVTSASKSNSNTTKGTWSPSRFPVAHFGFAPARMTTDPEPLLRPYRAAPPFASATLDGVIYLAHPAVALPQVMVERFSLSGILTPENEVSYTSGSSGTSNGYGTLAQAGWTRQLPILGVNNAGAMAMAQFGDSLALLFQPAAGGAVHIAIGAYS